MIPMSAKLYVHDTGSHEQTKHGLVCTMDFHLPWERSCENLFETSFTVIEGTGIFETEDFR